MGEYKSQYEKYYKNLRNKVPGKTPKPASSYDYLGRGNSGNNRTENRFVKKFIFQLVGALILLVIFMGIKLIPIEGAKEAYIVTREALDKNFDVEEAIMAMNIPGVEDYKENILDYIDNFKSFVTGDKTLKEDIKDNYVIPVVGTVSHLSGENVGIIIQTDSEMDVIASFDGKIREIKEDGDEKHIIVDHGNGIETYYGLISTVDVKEGDKVEKGQSIGKTGVLDSEGTKGIVYKISYMGVEKDPVEMMDFSSLKSV